MKTLKDSKTQIHLYFDNKMFDMMKSKAFNMGMSVNEWVKFLIFKNIESTANSNVQENRNEKEQPLDEGEPKTLDKAIARRPFINPADWIKHRDLESKLMLKEAGEEGLLKELFGDTIEKND